MKSRPRALIVGPTPPPYHGMTTFTLTVLQSPVLNAGYELLHLDTADRRSQENMGRLDLRNVVLALKHAAELGRLLIRRRPDVVLLPIGQNRWAYVRDALFIAICHAVRTPVLTHLNGAGFREFYETTDPLTRALVRRTIATVRGVGVLGSGLRHLFDGLLPPDRIRVLPNGIDDPFPDGAPVRVGDLPQVTYMGTLIRSKGFLDLIEAAARLRDEGTRAKFVLAGAWNSDAERDEALALVHRLRLAGVVEFVGLVTGERKRTLLEQSDVFVLPTWYPPEGQPFAILEAMAAALPTVTTARGAIPDMIIHGETGLLVRERNIPELAAAIGRLLASPGERARLGDGARRRYLSRFTEEAAALRLADALAWAARN